jgi:hypothetical protein
LVALGILTGPGAIAGLLWKKKRLNTIIQYKDATDVHTIALDFDANVKYVEPIIRERMTAAQHISLLPISSNMDSDKPTISIVSKLNENLKSENQIIGSNKDNDNTPKSKMPISISNYSIDEAMKSADDNDNTPKSKMPISISSHPVTNTDQTRDDKSPSNQMADKPDTPLTTSNAAKMNNEELLQILKMRLVKGEISKEEYIELKMTIES